MQLTEREDGSRAGMGVKLYHVYSRSPGINREPNVHFRELAHQAVGWIRVFLQKSEPNSNSGHMVQDTYGIHLSWHICKFCGGKHIFKRERKDTKRLWETEFYMSAVLFNVLCAAPKAPLKHKRAPTGAMCCREGRHLYTNTFCSLLDLRRGHPPPELFLVPWSSQQF